MKNQIPYNKQYIDLSDIKSVSSALKEKLITQGKFVKKFEKKVAKFVNSKFALSCINGTAGLDMVFKSITKMAITQLYLRQTLSLLIVWLENLMQIFFYQMFIH